MIRPLNTALIYFYCRQKRREHEILLMAWKIKQEDINYPMRGRGSRVSPTYFSVP